MSYLARLIKANPSVSIAELPGVLPVNGPTGEHYFTGSTVAGFCHYKDGEFTHDEEGGIYSWNDAKRLIRIA